jgi:serine/threonine protein kinase
LKFVRKLGEGSFGTVWAGECFEAPVAIKVLITREPKPYQKERREQLEGKNKERTQRGGKGTNNKTL